MSRRDAQAVLLGAAVVAMATASGAAEPQPFSGVRAMQHLEALCRLGPRPSGSAAMTRQRSPSSMEPCWTSSLSQV